MPSRLPTSDRERAALAENGPAEPLHAPAFRHERAPEAPHDRPDWLTIRGWPHNPPRPLTSFVGREREVAEAGQLLGGTRLLTLRGAGGVGKTRLGYEVAAGQSHVHPDGVWLVELAALAEAGLVAQAVATALDVREEPERPLLTTLTAALRDRSLLLVLDNCEHLIEACAALADALLRGCPDVRILATSRQAIGIAGETTFLVPSLSLSRPCSATSTLTAESEAVRLFVERARAVVPTFALTDRDAPAVEQICRRLDGIPLAIELAAARVAVLSPSQIVERLGNRFGLLTGGSRTALPRYRTLRALVDWSHDLLDERERILLRRLAVFAGGWTLEAAESVCALDGLMPEEVLDLLSGLVMKSLVLTTEQTMEAGETRYRFLESPREYAAEKLREAGEEAALRRQHGAWFLALAERAERDMFGPRQAAWLQRLGEDHDNQRAALAWSAESGDVEGGVRLAVALYPFWLTRGFVGEGRRWLAELLGRSDASTSEPQAAVRALQAAGRLAISTGDLDTAHHFLVEALAAARRHDDRPGIAAGTHGLGFLARMRGDFALASTLLKKSLDLFRELDDPKGIADTLLSLGVVAHFQDDLAAAQELYEQSLAAYRALGYQKGIAIALNDLGEVALERGDLEAARRIEAESLTIAQQIGNQERIAYAVAAFAGVAASQGRSRRALRLAGAATALREAIGGNASATWQRRFERWLAPARRVSSVEAQAAAEAEGRAMSLETAIAYALAPDDAAEPEDTALEPPPTRADVACLSDRELEVVALIARGLTNRQIAAELVIAVGTAANHVKHILARLGLESRVQVAAWAVERGLHERRSA